MGEGRRGEVGGREEVRWDGEEERWEEEKK